MLPSPGAPCACGPAFCTVELSQPVSRSATASTKPASPRAMAETGRNSNVQKNNFNLISVGGRRA